MNSPLLISIDVVVVSYLRLFITIFTLGAPILYGLRMVIRKLLKKPVNYPSKKFMVFYTICLLLTLIPWQRYILINDMFFYKRYIPANTINQANKYLVNQVGQANFDKYFEYLPLKSYREDSLYNLVYDFAPLKKYVGYDVTLRVSTTDNQKIYPNANIPDCTSDQTLCQFNLNLSEIENLRTKYNFSKRLSFDPPFITAELCKEIKLIKIDYRTKEYEIVPDPDVSDANQLNELNFRCFEPVY